MNYTQNSKIAQVTEKTLVVGVDIGSETNFARAFNWRGQELSKKVFRFSNSMEGFQSFLAYLEQCKSNASAEQIIVGCEPTGHYWFNLARYLKTQHISLALVNPYHVKQIKELDDNSPKKTDLKDPKTIAKLVVDGRYSYPYLPEGIYADLREASASSMVPEYQNATSANTDPVAAKSYTMGHRPRVGASAAPNCGQAEQRNLGRRRERMILLDMGGLLPQEEWVLHKAVIAKARRCLWSTHLCL